jgi:hypothetical protein
MTGGVPESSLRRASAILVALVWAVVVLVAISTLGIVTGLVLGVWGAPILVAIAALGVHAVRRLPRRSTPEPAVIDLRPTRLTAG